MFVVHQDEKRHGDERENDGGQRHRKNSQVERVNSYQNQQRTRKDKKGISNIKASVGFRRFVLAPITTEHLSRDICLAHTDFKCCSETRYSERSGKENKTPVAERICEHHRSLLVIFNLYPARKKNQRRHNQNAERNKTAEAHPQHGDSAIHSEIPFIPFVFDCAGRIKVKKIRTNQC